MWFRRKLKNRRHAREFVLDVKLRSSKVRATRVRMAAVSLGVVFTVVLAVYLAWQGADWGLRRLVYENNAFAIREMDVQTDGVLPLDRLRRWTGVKFGDNLLALDLARVKRDLEMVSLIQSVSVERILPHTLKVRVVEREPLAKLTALRPREGGGIDQRIYQLDAEGWVMTPLESPRTPPDSTDANELLPVVYGLSATEVQGGRRIALPQLQAALKFLAAFLECPMQSVVDLKSIDISSPDVLTVVTGQGSEIILGLTDFERQLRRWQLVYDSGQRLSKAIAWMDLAVSNNVPVRWLEASAVPPAPPKVTKPLRTRKKHV
jgi:cell division septal protein FtsQ